METIRASLTGNDRDEHVFSLRQSLELYDTYQSKIAECDRVLEASMAALIDEVEKPAKPLSKARVQTKPVNAPAFDVRAALYGMLGVDLTQIHGLGPSLALKLVSECGRDLKAWPSAKHFTSWLCLAPGNKISGGKVLSSKTRRSSSKTRRCCAWRRQPSVEQTLRLGLSIDGCRHASANPKPLQPRRGRSRCSSTMLFVTTWNTRILGRITMTSDIAPVLSPAFNAVREL
jgi:transposase